MNRRRPPDLATADGHDRYVPMEGNAFLAAGHEGVYEWSVEHLVREGAAFLDLGCGTGYGSTMVAAAGATYEGLDSSPAAIEFARAHYARRGVRFRVADLLEPLPPDIAPRSYDVVFSSEVLEHVTDPFALVDVMAHFVRDDGACFVGTPNRLWSRDHLPSGGLLARSHVMEFTAPALEGLLRTAFADVHVMFRVFPRDAIVAAVVPPNRPRLVRGVLAFAEEVAPSARKRARRVIDRRVPQRAWSSKEILWVDPGDPRLDEARAVGLAAVCRGPKR